MNILIMIFSYFFDIEHLQNYYTNIIEIKNFQKNDNNIIISTTNESNNLFNKKEDKYYGYFNGYEMEFTEKCQKNNDIYKLENYKYENLFF
jgi:cellulose biosynthesis protein BcsQ